MTFSRAIALIVICGSAPVALAQPESCPAGNLLAGKRPSHWQDIRGRIELATDGEAAPEGAIWNASLATILDSPAAALTWDLGEVVTVNAAWIQADANDYYTIWGSADGRSFRHIGRIEPVDGHGLRGRKVALGGAPIRFLRFGEGQGDGFYSVSEIQLFCQLPVPFPPALRVGQAAQATVPLLNRVWNNETSARWELVLAVAGFALLHWGSTLRRQGRPDARRKLRDRLLAVLGALAALSYVNFGSFHFGIFTHDHEWTHYYLGSKYFQELSYDRLYECLSIADVEDGLQRRVELRKITNLRTNILETTADVLAHPERCKSHFSGERWQSFKHDASFFRARQSPQRWDRIQLDHGYNATPVWNVAGAALSNLSPASTTQLYALALLDPLYLVAMIAIVWWAFGWRVLSVALLVFATNFPSRFFWTGGSFLRWDWLFYLVAALCLLKKERPALAGAALAYATLLRIFPLFVFVGPGLGLLWHLHKERRLPPRHARFFAGAALATALLVPLSLYRSGGITAYRQFVHNTAKHQETPLVNNMGLQTVLSWRPSNVGRHTFDDTLVDPWERWKKARHDGFRQALPLYVALVLAALALLALAARHLEPWSIAALSVTLIPLGVELTSYYYAFIIGVALLWEKREEVGRWLLLLTAFTGFMAWAPLVGMSTWEDEQYTAMAAATVGVFGALLWWFRKPAIS